jgi:pimeloyl-ACP methyl ester carboxylesterase
MRIAVDGRPVRIDTGGRPFDPSLPCLALIHGAGHDHFVWKSLSDRLAAAGLAVLAADLPGHGASGGPPLPSIEAMADWLLALLEKLGVGGTVSLAGHSMGSLVALEAAARLPGRVRHLFLLGTSMPMPVSPALLQAAREDEAQARTLINQWSHSRRALLGACGGPGLWLPAINLRIMERQRPGVLHGDLAACDAYRPTVETFTRPDCPVTLIAGGHDRMTPLKAAYRLAAQLGDKTRLVELPGVGHAMLAEAPQACHRTLAAVLGR